jgi:hypothetical protein
MILFLIAYILLLPLSFLNYIVVVFTAKDHAKGYFRSTAVNMDKFGNREFRALWNKTLRKSGGYKFGNIHETVSSALGKNERDGTLSKTGKALAWILNFIDKDHCKKSITEL